LDGLLTAVFDAYSRRTFPDVLLGTDDDVPLFAGEIHTVMSDTEKSTRVWNGLERKASQGFCDMLLHVWLSELPGADELLLKYIVKTFADVAGATMNHADDDVRRIRQIALKVSRERLHVIQFVRFQKAADGIYFAPAAPLYNVLPLTIPHFCDRFADQMWLAYDIRRRYGYFYDMKKAVEVTLENDENLLDGKLDESIMAEDEKLFQQAWKDYTKALTIKERLNPRLQRQNMPARFWKYMPEKNR
jgi:probable DNA metabolism protein